jgi:hypothetical protein
LTRGYGISQKRNITAKLDSGSSGVTAVEVRVLLAAPTFQTREALLQGFFSFFVFLIVHWMGRAEWIRAWFSNIEDSLQ